MIFLAVFFSLTAITHFSLYRFVLRWFDISHPAAKAVLLAAVSFLAVSFMAAFFLLRWVETPWTINFYRFAAVWFALSVKLVLAVAATWTLVCRPARFWGAGIGLPVCSERLRGTGPRLVRIRVLDRFSSGAHAGGRQP